MRKGSGSAKRRRSKRGAHDNYFRMAYENRRFCLELLRLAFTKEEGGQLNLRTLRKEDTTNLFEGEGRPIPTFCSRRGNLGVRE